MDYCFFYIDLPQEYETDIYQISLQDIAFTRGLFKKMIFRTTLSNNIYHVLACAVLVTVLLIQLNL